VGPNFVSARI